MKTNNVESILNSMLQGQEYLSIAMKPFPQIAVADEMQSALSRIAEMRKRNILCYVANILKPIDNFTSICINDEKPLLTLLETLTDDIGLDIVLMTPGGSLDTVEFITNKIRSRFHSVSFIVLNTVMSAGTVFCLSGNELLMDDKSYIGPTDPQIQLNGNYVPYQSLDITLQHLNNNLNKEQPDSTTQAIVHSIDPKDVGCKIACSERSITLAQHYLTQYMFKNSTTIIDKEQQAIKTAKLLCNYPHWLSHGKHITRDIAEKELHLPIEHLEEAPELKQAVETLSSLVWLIFERTKVSKIYATNKRVIHQTIDN